MPSGIVASVNGGGDTVTLTGTATLAEYETAIELIRFQSTSDNPSTVDRVITVVVNDGDSNSNIATSTIHVTALPDLTISNAVADEGGNLIFDLTLDSPAAANILIELMTSSGTATDGTDFENNAFEYSTDGGATFLPAGGANKTVVGFLNGSTAIQVRVNTIDDPNAEGAETMTLSVASVVFGTIDSTSDTGTGTINDETPGDTATVSLSGPGSVDEGNIAGVYVVSVDEAPTSDLTVQLSYSGTAVDGVDLHRGCVGDDYFWKYF